MAKHVVWFSEVDRKDLALVGGKGGNLGEMVQAGLPVPDGFIVTSEAYYAFLEQTGLRSQIEQLLTGLDANNSKQLQETSKAIKSLIITTPMPEEIMLTIMISYNKLAAENPATYVAVRSSATAEDLPGASFAGQQATYLNIHGPEDVVKATQNCWASLFEARAIFYRQDKGFDHMKVGIAVPVQRMVQSEKSGIMFTVDPITNDRTKIVIEAGFGLGEAVVSGSITPDRYIVDKATWTIVDKEINEQDFMITRRAPQQAAPQPVPVAPVQPQPVPEIVVTPAAPAVAPATVAAPPTPAANPVATQPAAAPATTPAATVVPETNNTSTSTISADEGTPFIISEDELKADLAAIKASYPVVDDNNSVSLTSTVRSLTFTFSGNADPTLAVPVAPDAVIAPMIGETMAGEEDPNEHIALGPDRKGVQKMTDEEIIALAKIGGQIEEHYQYPQDTEWAIENGKIYIVQARPVTTLEDNNGVAGPTAETTPAAPVTGEQAPTILLKGGGASVGSASGPVKVIHSPSEIDKILKGDVLVTEMTTPDYVPAMKRAAAIVTDTGGRTCHAAIVSRELGIPCVVGTKEAAWLSGRTIGLLAAGAVAVALFIAHQRRTDAPVLNLDLFRI
ncbi:MAG TPA: PEP/pyruvate-binding domain-containing protein, partial [bacterium]|nr:PEP/pyruvate-binding domain-containing protein [bacterium]